MSKQPETCFTQSREALKRGQERKLPLRVRALGLAVGVCAASVWLGTVLVDQAQHSSDLEILEFASQPRGVQLASLNPTAINLVTQVASAQQSESVDTEANEFRDRFERGGLSPTMVIIPDGTFLMGSTPEEEGHVKNEAPQHEVTIRRFAISKYEITETQFSEFLLATETLRQGACDVYSNGSWSRLSATDISEWLSSVDEPAICVNWNQASAFAEWLSLETGHSYRLPSEDEWEYAARAGSQTAFSFGDEAESGCVFMNGADRSAEQTYRKLIGVSCDDGYAHLAPVGSLLPNAFGLHDMHGNVWEWTSDAWTDSHAADLQPGDKRVIKGGSWFSYAMWLRSANRNAWEPDIGRADVGFRVVRDVASEE